MLRISWIFIIHDLIVTLIPIGMLTQLFYIKTTAKQVLTFVVWMQVLFLFNDFFVEVYFSLEWKYLIIFMGFFLGFWLVMRLSFLSTLLVMIMNLVVNGIATNLNIFALLLNQFRSYGLALESDFIQYTSLVMVQCMLYMIIKTFNLRFVDISRYD